MNYLDWFIFCVFGIYIVWEIFLSRGMLDSYMDKASFAVACIVFGAILQYLAVIVK